MLDAFESGLHLDTMAKVEAFSKLWSEWCYDFIHHHHEIEEETYMPWINERVPSPAGLVIEHDHQALLAKMDAISAAAKEKTLEAGARLSDMLATFAKGMGAHLANEEAYVPQMLRDAEFTQEDESALIGQVMQSLAPQTFATMMPLILYAMDKAGGYGQLTGAAFFGTLPPPVQEAYPAWKATFESDFLAVLAELQRPFAPPSTAQLATTTTTAAPPSKTTTATPLIDGFRTARVDTSDLRFQADPKYMPDKAALWKTDESHDGWVHAHNAIRFEIGELKRVLTALEMRTLAEWQVAAVQTWWANHETHVHEHHSNEDDVFNPFVRTRVIYPEKLEADHLELVAAMEAVGTHVRSLAAGSTLGRLLALWLVYEELMLPHLYEEEQVGLPLVRAYFTPKEVEKVVSSFMQKGDPVSIGSFVHVMGHKKDAKAFMRENAIPPFVWHVPGKGFKALRTLYRTKQQVHIDSLLAGEPVRSKTKRNTKENASKAATYLSKVVQAPPPLAAALPAQCALSPCKRVNVTRIMMS